jgi:hypothetical protein
MVGRASLLCIALVACRFRPSATVDDAPAGSAAFDGRPIVVGIDAAVSYDDAAIHDAAIVHDAPPDAGITIPNTVTCYTQASQTATCALPTHCCFSNFDAQHDGTCGSSACAWGTISCDGPEDCSAGQRCCSHAIFDADQGLMGYTVACQAGPCGAAPINQEICHAGTCSSGTCVSALGHDNDLPRTLDICQ